MNKLITHLQEYVAKHLLFDASAHILVAVSGGIDSMVLLHLLQTEGYKVSVAHCNFKLRGQEADGDEAFVKQYCQKHKLPLHNESFNTADVAKHTGESIQMAARRLRYEWFDALCLVHKYACVATAHNANDVAETFFVNLSRGTGLSGLTGIKPKNGNIARPLLFATRAHIEAYAKTNKIVWRDDSSNQSTKYRRNLIRHKVVPVMEEINPSFIKSILATISRLEDSNVLLRNLVDEKLEDVIAETGDKLFTHIDKLKKLKPLSLYLYELLNGYGFNADQAEAIEQALERQPGQRFYSEEYELYRDREFLVIQPAKEKEVNKIYLINDDFKTENLPIKLYFKVVMNDAKIDLKQAPTVALLDFGRIKFPLTLRRWQQGDRFQPFGMNRGKLLSDFFNDNKISQAEKDELWVLESDGKIAWIVGYRTDNRFRVSEKTTGILQIALT